MDLLWEAEQGNRIFRISFPSGAQIPFRLLSWSEYTMYRELSLKGSIPQPILESLIFEKCVAEQACIDNVDSYLAGVITTVVNMIMSLSGPTTPEDFNEGMGAMRETRNALNSQIIMVICRAFPAYKPEDLEEMNWAKIMERLAQAELILLSKNPPEMTEELRMLTSEEAAKKAPEKKSGVNIKVDASQLVADEGKAAAAEMGGRPGPASRRGM